MKRKISNFATLALLTLVATTACGPNGNGSSEDYTSLDDGDIIRDGNGKIVYDKIELEMWSVTTGLDAGTQDDLIEEFNQMYEGMIDVTTRHISRYDLEALLQTTMEFDRENAPDMLFTHGARAAEYLDRQWLKPVDPYYEKAGLYLDKEDFTSSLLEASTVGDYLYGVPQDVHSAILEIREDILLKNDLEVPETFAELIAVTNSATELAAAGNLWIRGENAHNIPAETWRKASTVDPYYPLPFSYGDMWVHEFVGYTATTQNGGKIVDNHGMPAWNDANTAQGMQILKDMIFPTETSSNKHALSKVYGSDYDVGDAPFRTGEAIFKFNGPWVYQNDLTNFDRDLKNDGGSTNITTRNLGNLFAKNNETLEAGLIKGEGHAIMLMSSVDSMTKSTAAVVFADYMANYSGIEWAKRGHLPALQSVASSTEFTSDPAFDQYIKHWGTSADYVVVPSTKYYSYIDTYYKQSLQQSLSNEFKNKAVNEILLGKYNDCINYIELYS